MSSATYAPPTRSITTSTPRPPLISFTFSANFPPSTAIASPSPIGRARSSFAAVRAVPMENAPMARAIWTAAVPTPLPAAWTSTVSPAASRAWLTIAS